MTTLNPLELFILKLSGWRLRVWLAVAIFVVLVTLPSKVSLIVLWLAALPYLGLIETLVRILGEQHSLRQRLEAERDRYAAQLARHEAQIVELEADLHRARSACRSRQETEADAIYRRVGLHPQAPGFLVTAAQRAFRAALHPDRHPHFARQAHQRYLLAETTFEQIHELRR